MSPKKVSCLKCNKKFRSQELLQNHIKTSHKKERKVELNEFSEPEDLMEGIDVSGTVNTDSEDNKGWYNPNDFFSNNVLLNNNLRYREDELKATEIDLREIEAKEHVCQTCNQQFSLRTTLLDHIVSCQQGDDIREFYIEEIFNSN